MRALFANDAIRPKSLIYRLDVRTKILISLIASVSVIFLKSPLALGFLALVSALYVLNLGRWRIVFVCYLGILIMWFLAIGCMHLMHQISEIIPISNASKMLIPFLRALIMINTVLTLALSSRIQTLLTSLKMLKLPIWIYIPAAVMIRFIPTFIKDVRQIHETMRIRGYSLNPIFIARHPIVSMRLLIAPILFRALRSSDDLGIAAELKGVSHNAHMVSYKPQHFTQADTLAMVLTLFFLATGILIQVHAGDAPTGFFL